MRHKVLLCGALVFGSPAWAAVGLAGFGVGPSGGVTPHPPSSPANEVIFGTGFEIVSPNGSAYLSLTADTTVNAPRSLVSRTVYVPTAGWAYLQSDGRYFSTTMPSGDLAEVYITLDGVQISNKSTVDWTNSKHVSQRCFNAIAAAYLTQGYHDIALIADGQSFEVGAGSNLSLMANAASQIYTSTLSGTGGPYSFSIPSDGLLDGSPLLPSYVVLTQSVATTIGAPVASFSSFSETNAGRPGDAMSAIYANGAEPTISQGTWTDNDGYSEIELRAPMYSQALFNATGTSTTVSLNASLYPWTTGSSSDDVEYSIDTGAQLLTLVGGMNVVGSSLRTGETFGSNEVHWGNFVCIGTNDVMHQPGCPIQGTDTRILSKMFTVPTGHSGVVLFSTKARMQGDPSDTGGNVFLFLKLDGVAVGSTGVEGITSSDGASERTLSASYLSAADKVLSPGTHSIEVWANASGGFIHMTLALESPLMYVD